MRLARLLFLLCLVIPGAANAIQLHWSSGNTTLAFTQSTRCTLVVESEPGETALPSEWRLLWVARGCPALAVVPDSSAATGGTVHASRVESQSNVDKQHSVQTVQFANGMGAGTALITVDLPAGSAGKFQVVAAIHPAGDSTTALVVRSLVVEFNGGLTNPFPPAILHTAADHATSQFVVRAKGVGLAQASIAAVSSSDLSWKQPLGIVEATDTTITAQADVPALLPDGVVQVSNPIGMGGTALLAAAPNTVPIEVVGNSWVVNPEPGVALPKDFAFFYNIVPTNDPVKTNPQWRGLFHLIYIRHLSINGAEVGLGHAWSQHLNEWTVDPNPILLEGPPGSWDAEHVWAPSLVQHGNSYYMFYTGTDVNNHNQAIGYVRTSFLDTLDTKWEPTDGPTVRTKVFDAFSTSWVSRPSTFQQLRDPFVFRHPAPDSSGVFFMLYSAADQASGGVYAIGVARNKLSGNPSEWIDLGPYGRSEFARNGFPTALGGTQRNDWVEGPHLFFPPSTPQGNWRVMYSWGGDRTGKEQYTINTFAALNASTPVTDTSAISVGAASALVPYLGGDQTASGWQGTEYLKLSPTLDFLAGFNAYFRDGIHIAQLNWTGLNFALRTPALTSVNVAGSRMRAATLRVLGFEPSAHRFTFEASLPAKSRVRLAIYDVAGRVVRDLVDAPAPAGTARYDWNGNDSQGVSVKSGVYFARMVFDGGSRSLSLPLVH